MSRVSSVRMGSAQTPKGWRFIGAATLIVSLGIGCDDGSGVESGTEAATATVVVEEMPDPVATALAERSAAVFGVLPRSVPNSDNVGTLAKLDLGRMLYYDTRLSKNHDSACNSCHLLDA